MFFTIPNHLFCFVTAFVLDLLLGTSKWKPKLSCVYKMEYGAADNWIAKKEKGGNAGILGLGIPLLNVFAAIILLHYSFKLSPALGIIAEIIIFSLLFNLKNFLASNNALADSIEEGRENEVRKRLDLPEETDEEANDNGPSYEFLAAGKISRQTAEEVVGVLFYAFFGGIVLGYLYHGLALFSREYKDYKPDKTVRAVFRIFNFIPEYLCRLVIPFAGFASGKPFRASRQEITITLKKLKFGQTGSAEGAFAGALGVKVPGEELDSGYAFPYPKVKHLREMNKIMLEAGWTVVFLALVIGLAL